MMLKGWTTGRGLLVGGALMVLGVGCGQKASTPERGVAQPPPKATFSSLSVELFKPTCVGCHSGPNAKANVRLDDFAAMTAPFADDELVVAPGKPDESLLVKVLEATDPEADPPRMPPTGPAVDPALVAKVRSWVEAGAPGE